MNTGEKRRKNLPLERLFMVWIISPATPKPIRSSLNDIIGTLRRC
jgi:hypothetical protein